MSADKPLVPVSRPCSTRTGSVMAAKADVERRTVIRTAGKHLFMAGHFKAFSGQPRQLTAKGAKDAKESTCRLILFLLRPSLKQSAISQTMNRKGRKERRGDTRKILSPFASFAPFAVSCFDC